MINYGNKLAKETRAKQEQNTENKTKTTHAITPLYQKVCPHAVNKA